MARTARVLARTSPTLALIVVATLLVANPLGPAHRGAVSGGAPTHPAPPSVAPSAPAAIPSTGFAPASLWAGTTAATVFPNYNGSLPGNFASIVKDWQVGSPAYVPSTHTVWWPERPVSVNGSPPPSSAPALVYNLTTQAFDGFVPEVANASAFAFDPANGLLYATIPGNNSVEAIDPSTRVPVAPAIPVGISPGAIVFDPSTGYLFVANAGSDTVTIINGQARPGSVAWTGIPVGSEPVAFADDSVDGMVYVVNAESAYLSRIAAASPTQAQAPTLLLYGPGSGIAYSSKSGYIAVTTLNSANLTIVKAKTGAVVTTTIAVGLGCGPVTDAAHGTLFVVAKPNGDSLSFVNATTLAVLPGSVTVDPGPDHLLLDPGSGSVVAWSNVTRTISVVDPVAESVTAKSVSLLPRPIAVAFDANVGQLFVADAGSPSVERLDPFSGRSLAVPIDLPSAPFALSVDAAHGRLFVGLNGSVRAYNVTTGALEAENSGLAGENGALALDPQDGRLWVANRGSGELVALNSTTLATSGISVPFLVPIGASQSLVVDPSDDSLFVLGADEGTVRQFNGSTGSWIGDPTIAGSNVTALAWDPADGLVYAAGDSLTAVDPSTMALVVGPVAIGMHTAVGGMAYEPSRQALYIATQGSGPWSGSLAVVEGSSAAAAQSGVTILPVGFGPGTVAPIEPAAGGLPSSGVIAVANAISGTLSLVAALPQVLSATFVPPSIDQGGTTGIVVAALGGAGASVVSYDGLPDGCLSLNVLAFNCTPSQSGSFEVVVTVQDALGRTASAVAKLEVLTPIVASATVSPLVAHRVDAGTSLSLTGAASGGAPPYNLTWDFGDGSTATGPTASHAFAVPGWYEITLEVSDQGGGLAVNRTAVEVVPAPSVEVLAAPHNWTDVDLPLNLTAVVSGGIGPGSGTWSLGDGATASGATVSHAWSQADVYTVRYTYTDASGVVASTNLEVLVSPPLTGEFSVDPSGSNPVVGTPFEFNASLTGGTPGYRVTWSFGDGSSAVGTEVVHAYAAAGNYRVKVDATDASGGAVNATFENVSVGAPSGAPSSVLGGGFGPSFALGLVVGGAIAAAALFAAERSRHRHRPGPPSPYVPPAETGRRGRG